MVMTKRGAISVLLTLLLITAPQVSESLNPFTTFTHYRNLLSLSHSLFTRVSNLRAERGDFTGSARAQTIARTIQHGLSPTGFMKFTWDYIKNYPWTSAAATSFSFEAFGGLSSEVNELLRTLNELTRIDSGTERAAWIGRNYGNVLRVSKSLVTRLLRLFRQPGPVRDVVELLQLEVVEGDLIRDCLELSSNDLKGLVKVLKDIASQYVSTSSSRSEL